MTTNPPPPIEIDIAVQDPGWESLSPDCEALIERAIHAVFATCPVALGLLRDDVMPELSVVLANDDLVRMFNRDYRDKDKPTNILSFAQLDEADGWTAPDTRGPCALGDLILARETIVREAAEAEKPLNDHLTHLIIHGTLHLLGYDHMEDEEAEAMESLEIRILKGLGIENPYQIPA